MIVVGQRRRGQPAPPHVLFEALSRPDRDPFRPWLVLLDDELQPRVISSDFPTRLTWSSLWLNQPDAIIEFDLTRDNGDGTNLQWTLLVTEPKPDDALVGHFRKRLNQLINANLRFTFGQ